MRHAVYALCLLFAATGIGHAQGDKAKPNTLTPKEIADGWILLFDGETTFGWNADGEQKAVKGDLRIGAQKKTRAQASRFVSYELTYDYSVEPIGEWKGEGLDSRFGGFWLQQEEARFGKRVEKAGNEKKWHSEKIYVDNEARVFKQSWWGEEKLKAGESAPPVWEVDPDTVLALRNVKLRPLNMKPLFNGKDLDGWQEFPGKKSKFTVENGEIHLTNGPGDLQTVGKYKDFILQLECKSNGKHLNSGIFFRCKDGEYQNGYEAQIHNKFLPEAKKYMIEDYDAKTNKLLGKTAMEFTADDYGTGGIYRRMPARKQMAKDGEWFTMTIVAHGNHIATWVNGVQVVDWTDNRPKSDNPRNGCRLEAGHISIQGHDPTTDLSFRNIRIAEFK